MTNISQTINPRKIQYTAIDLDGLAIRDERERIEQNHIDAIDAARGKCPVCGSRLQTNGLCFYDCNPLEVEPAESACGNYREEEVAYYRNPD